LFLIIIQFLLVGRRILTQIFEPDDLKRRFVRCV
jgi:hypothetical protein